MKLIAFDLDGVLADTISLTRIELLKIYGMDINKYPKRGNRTYRISLPDVPEKDISTIIYKCITEYWDSIQPYPDAQEAIKVFYAYYETPIQIVTARKYKDKIKVLDSTLKWLKKVFPDVEFNVAFKGHKEKVDFLVENKYNIFIEDRLRNANIISEKLDTVYLINRSWNIGRLERENVIRVNSVKEAVNKITERRIYGAT